MTRQIVLNLFSGIIGICGIMVLVIGCDNFGEELITEIIDPDPIELADNEWGRHMGTSELSRTQFARNPCGI